MVNVTQIVFLSVRWSFLAIFFTAVLFLVPPTAVAKTSDVFSGLIGARDAVLFKNASGKVLFSKNAHKKLIPASTLKVFTALVALHYLGPDYRFPTEFYLDRESNLKIKGYGDPMLLSEFVSEIAGLLRKIHITVNDIILDDTYFSHSIHVPGVYQSFQPYDAINGALCVNFNTVNFKKNSKGVFVSAEPQTPLLPIALGRIRESGHLKGRIVFSREEKENTRYTGHMFRYFFEKQGIASSGVVKTGVVDKTRDHLILSYDATFSIEQVIAELLEYSNNFIANQVLLAAGAKKFGPPATMKKGVRAAMAYAETILGIKNISLVEGSGISRQNRISAFQMMRILEAFQPYHRLMRHKGKEFYKTGTLYGIKARAGYFEGESGELNRYVVMVNTPGKSTDKIIDRALISYHW